MANFGKLTSLAEKIAARLGYETAEQAEQQMGDRFVRKVEQESFLMRGGEEAQSVADMPDVGTEAFTPRSDTPPSAAGMSESVGQTGFTLRDRVNPENLPVPIGERLPAVIPGQGPIAASAGGSFASRISKGIAGLGALGGAGYAATRGNEEAEAAKPDAPQQETDSTVSSEPVPAGPAEASPGGVDEIVAGLEATINKNLGPEPTRPGSGGVTRTFKEFQDAAAQVKRQGIDTGALEADIKEAKREYRETRDRNQLLESLQLVASAFGNLAGAYVGKKRGRYLGEITPGTIDYANRTKQAASDRDASVTEARSLAAVRQGESDRDYQARLDELKPLKERSEMELSLFREANDRYQTELRERNDAIRNAIGEVKQGKRDEATEARINREAGRTMVDDLARDESNLLMTGKQLLDPKRAEKLDLDSIADRVGITEEERQAAFDSAKQEEMFGDPDDKEVRAKLLPLIQARINASITALRKSKQDATKMLQTGKALEQVQAESLPPAGGGGGRVIRAKRTNETIPYSAEVWNKIQAGPEAADFELLNQ